MRGVHLATVQADDAHRVATDDRSMTADLVLSLAVREAVDLIRAGRVGRAEYRLARALGSARRILGETTSQSPLPGHTRPDGEPAPPHAATSGPNTPTGQGT